MPYPGLATSSEVIGVGGVDDSCLMTGWLLFVYLNLSLCPRGRVQSSHRNALFLGGYVSPQRQAPQTAGPMSLWSCFHLMSATLCQRQCQARTPPATAMALTVLTVPSWCSFIPCRALPLAGTAVGHSLSTAEATSLLLQPLRIRDSWTEGLLGPSCQCVHRSAWL